MRDELRGIDSRHRMGTISSNRQSSAVIESLALSTGLNDRTGQDRIAMFRVRQIRAVAV